MTAHAFLGALAVRAWVLDRFDEAAEWTARELHEVWSGDPQALDAALRELRNGGTLVCTDGTWWKVYD